MGTCRCSWLLLETGHYTVSGVKSLCTGDLRVPVEQQPRAVARRDTARSHTPLTQLTGTNRWTASRRPLLGGPGGASGAAVVGAALGDSPVPAPESAEAYEPQS